MINNLQFCFIVLATSCSLAQNIRLQGTIQDETSVPLEMASVMAMNQNTNTVDAYAITNDKGRFLLSLKPNASYAIKISYLGMNNKVIVINTKTQNITQNVILESANIALEGVEIIREMPVSIKGDTIVYNADSFKTGTERKLEDILKKLPGVEVNANGEIEVESKKVSKLMIDGKDFFDGDTKLGVKNIPADAIDKVQVLRNFNENSILKSVENNQDNVAMNIKLKAGKKNFWFGDVSAGIGVGHDEERYVANPKAFYYSPKYSINLMANFNNIGELPLTIQDYFKLTGGFSKMMAKGGSSFDISDNDLGFSLLKNNKAKDMETRFGAANFSYNPTKSWSLSGFGMLSSSITDLETKTQNTILSTGNQTISKETARQSNSFALFKISSSYKPSTKFQFDYDLLLKKSEQKENTALIRESIIDNNSNTEDIDTHKIQNPTSLTQNFSLYYTQSDKNIFAFETQHLYQDEDPFFNANLTSQPFNLMGYITDQNRNNINQNRFIKTNKIDSKLDYYYSLTSKSNLNITLGNTYSYQTFNSSIFQVLDSGATNNLNDPQNSNKVNYNFKDTFLGLHYKIMSGKFTFTPGLSLHSYTMKNQQQHTRYKQNFTRILPDFFVLYQIKKAESLTYNFSLTNEFTDINQLAEGNVLSSYNSLFKGNRSIENATSQTHTLRYIKYNMFNFENIFADITYARKMDAVKTNANFDGINQSRTPYNSNFSDETLSGFGSYGRSFLKHYKASISANLNWSKFNNMQDSRLITTESFTQNYTLKTATNYKNLPNLELGYSFTTNDYNNTTFYTEKPFVKLDYYFLNCLSFVTEYEFYRYYASNKSIENEYDFLSSSLIYQKKDSPWEYKIALTNGLNTKSLNDDSFSQFSTTTSQYTVQPRYLIFSLKYNL